MEIGGLKGREAWAEHGNKDKASQSSSLTPTTPPRLFHASSHFTTPKLNCSSSHSLTPLSGLFEHLGPGIAEEAMLNPLGA
eukprot:1159043-Pelagomonas_calceolata.AAC.4